MSAIAAIPEATMPLTRRVSRRDLADLRPIWFATASMYTLFAVLSIGTLLADPDPDRVRLVAFVGFIAVCAVTVLRGGLPPLDSVRNHVLLASVYVNSALAIWLLQPEPGAGLAVAFFIGPLTTMRLERRRAIASHYAAATAVLGVLGIVGLATGAITNTTSFALVLVVPGIWVIGISTMIMFEAIEAQGEELERLVRRDPLTGVGNRRLLMEHLEDELRRHERTNRPLSVIALDLNGFKALNDTHGHAAGDDLLRAVADALKATVGPRDIVVRQGGDEFCVILAETSAEHATRTANTIRAAFAEITFDGPPISGGFGQATFPDDGPDAVTLLHLADQRLGEHKRTIRSPRPAAPEAAPPPLRRLEDPRG